MERKSICITERLLDHFGNLMESINVTVHNIQNCLTVTVATSLVHNCMHTCAWETRVSATTRVHKTCTCTCECVYFSKLVRLRVCICFSKMMGLNMFLSC